MHATFSLLVISNEPICLRSSLGLVPILMFLMHFPAIGYQTLSTSLEQDRRILL